MRSRNQSISTRLVRFRCLSSHLRSRKFPWSWISLDADGIKPNRLEKPPKMWSFYPCDLSQVLNLNQFQISRIATLQSLKFDIAHRHKIEGLKKYSDDSALWTLPKKAFWTLPKKLDFAKIGCVRILDFLFIVFQTSKIRMDLTSQRCVIFKQILCKHHLRASS